jgi:hypothetical protein
MLLCILLVDKRHLSEGIFVKRRYFIQLGLTSLAGCSKARQKSDNSIQAGPFAVTVPKNWIKTTIVEKVLIRPSYSRADWEKYQKDEQYIMKPGYHCRPQHWAIRLPAALPKGISFDRKMAGNDPTAPQILIHKADEWGRVLTDGEHEDVKETDVLSKLKNSIDEAMLDSNSIDSPVYLDASKTFNCLKKRISFTGGYGIRLVTQWTIESTLMQFGELHYLFLGMSEDNSCQIIATFPLDLPGLPKSDDKNHLGHNIENYAEFCKNYDNYTEDAEQWLEKNENEITPSLKTLDEVMQSLVASHWES